MNCGARVLALASFAASFLLCSAAMGQSANPYTDTSALTDLSRYLLAARPAQVKNATSQQIDSYLASPDAQATNRGGNASTVTQIGSGNIATANMTAPTGGSYSGNTTVQTQLGFDNKSTVAAVGNDNALMTNQIGVGNNVSVLAYGSGNNYTASQVGTNLSYSLQQVGNNKSVSITQIGIGK